MAAHQARASVELGSRLSYDDVIDPRELRNALLVGLTLAEGRETTPRQPRSTGILP